MNKGLTNKIDLSVDLNYNSDSDSQLTIEIGANNSKKFSLAYQDQLMITFRINKALRNFEEYPNDVARGFVVEHMPIYYHLAQMS
jgi:hypothetical protein